MQALQDDLSAARRALERGDRATALKHADSALALDPDFLAAVALRERIVSVTNDQPQAPAPRPLVSPEGLVRFEQRARHRRIERRLAAARAAIDAAKFDEARGALDEVRELDPDHPSLIALGTELEAAEHRRPDRTSTGPWLAAAAVFGFLVLGASWIEESGRLVSYPSVNVAGLIDAPASIPLGLPSVTVVEQVIQPVGTFGPIRSAAIREPVIRQAATLEPLLSGFAPPPSVARVAETAPPEPLVFEPAVVAAAPPPAALSVSNAVAVSSPAAPSINDDQLVRQVLQRYRSAYETLDVSRARSVWPAVNQVALSRAFSGLSSQSLNFDDCNVELQGPEASAVCRGSARYVTKVGSREPRVEPRTWSFRLRKAGADWQIETARAER